MGKKKTAVFRKAPAKQQDVNNSKINAINTWDDIEHDSEDEFHDSRGEILLDAEPEQEEESENEIYGLDGLDQADSSSEEDDEDDEEEEEIEETTWGTSKKAYYNADEGSDLDEMREEEEEALKIQKQRLAELDEADFVDDTLPGWGIGAEANKEADRQLVDTVTKELDDISFDVSSSVATRRKNLPVAEKIKILQNESPELLDLLNEFKDKNETLNDLTDLINRIKENGKQDQEAAKFIIFQHQLLMNYLTNISFYFTLKASGTNDIRNHPVIAVLVELRGAIEKMHKLETKLGSQLEEFIQSVDKPISIKKPTANGLKDKHNNNKKTMANQSSEEEEEDDDGLDLYNETLLDDADEEEDQDLTPHDIEQEFKSLKNQVKKRKRTTAENDFADLDVMELVDMEDKLAKKRSIRDYVAKIETKQARLQSKYQGDSDLPYKERTQRQKKGVAQPQGPSADLDDQDWDEQDMQDATGDDDYVNVVKEKASRKAMKQAAYDATRAPLIDSDYKVEDGDKRLASYQILKNKGLTPHRKKENRNGRVKKRHQYEQKMKKFANVRQVAKPLTGTYGGETTGIKSHVSRSIKL
ncbi:Sas10 C-terminal domain-containing protein [Halteromyces radiatus]|uniref:Sas10 C-terminal domain-containing protein n=1 Tax=Halteromyces radiatus TaxID=101107 RepID=UPI00221E92CD|nr:Sas10 C-terminal domain-containing protein [Halteromyces radiatus]KAI8077851.1 Sas10 C-terminal domain-containing protein [Halteromyces radiatus]